MGNDQSDQNPKPIGIGFTIAGFTPQPFAGAILGPRSLQPLISPLPVVNPLDEALKSLAKSLQALLSSSSSSSSKDADGHFILVLLFTAWRQYIAKIKEALEDEAEHTDSDPNVFIPGGHINRPNWEKNRLTVYVFSMYGDYIDQPHMKVHKGLIMVYLDQTGRSKQLVLHRFDLSADYPEERSRSGENVKIKVGRIPAFEYAEEFYFRKMMETGQRNDIPSDLLAMLEKTRPDEVVRTMLNFSETFPHTSAIDMANTLLQFDMYNANMFQSSSDSSSSSSSRSSSSRDNSLTEMLHVRPNLFVNRNLPSYEGTLQNVSLLDAWKEVQGSMRDFPKEYSVMSANCIQFCNAILDRLQSNLGMKETKDDPVLQEIYFKPMEWLLAI